MKQIALAIYFLSFTLFVHAQDVQDNRMIGVISFAANVFSDSIAAKDVHATVSRILVQTKRFTVLDVSEWKRTQDEIDRQKDAAFLEQNIIEKGKSLGAKVLAIGMIKNAEIYSEGTHYSARVDYELKFIDVESGKSIAASSFKGDSETIANAGSKAAKGFAKLVLPSAITGKGNWKNIYMASAGFSALSEADKNTIKGKLIDAIEATTGRLNTWVRTTFDFSLYFLKVVDQDNKYGVQSVLIEGGEDIGMQTGIKLKMVLVTETETPRGRIRDEEPIADLEIEEVRAQTSKCKVIKGGKRVMDGSQNKNMRIVFN